MLNVIIDKKAKKPVYRQITGQITGQVKSGVLKKGARIPSTRELAEQTGLHRNTILRAYEELAAEGVLDSSPGNGTFITGLFSDANSFSRPAAANESGINWEVMIRSECKDDFEKEFQQRYHSNSSRKTIEFQRYLPDPAFYPYGAIRKIMSSVMRSNESDLYKYGNSAGHSQLREYLKNQAYGQGIDMSRNKVVIVNGSTQGLDLISRLILNSGDAVAIGIPCYTGVVRLFTVHGVRFISIPVNQDGLDIDVLEQAMKINPVKLLYVIPNFHNPTGATLSLEKRKRLIEVAKKHKVIVLEDDFNFQLRFSGSPIPPLKAFDTANQVIYSGTFSKILFSGFRIGWLIVPDEIYSNVLFVKKSLDISTSKLLQAVLYEFCRQGLLDRHIRKIRKINRERFNVAVESIKKYFPEEVSWWEPDGGMMIWVNLPEYCDPLQVQQAAENNGVSISASPFFAPRGEKTCGFRISYAIQEPENIKEGIKILGKVLKKALKERYILNNKINDHEGLTVI